MSVLVQLIKVRRRMQKEEQMLEAAGFDKSDPTYPLIATMLRMPRLLLRLVIAAILAPAVSLGAVGLGLYFWWPTGLVVRQTDQGTQIQIAAPKGVEAAWCVDGKTLFVTQKR